MKILSCVVSVASIICVLCTFDVSGEDLMLPLVRTTIDDCEIRYYRKILPSASAPVGVNAYPGEFAHIVAIGWTQPDDTVEWNCGGSLIWENVILTAAHCTADPATGYAPDIIRIGDLNIYDDEDDEFVQEREIVNIIRHPLYNAATVYNDLALLKLDEKVIPTFGSIPTCLWLNDSIPFSKVQAAGWGATGFDKGKTQLLVKAELTLMANNECTKYHNHRSNPRLRYGLKEHQLCAWDEVHDTCPGDSGGPLHHKLNYEKQRVPFLVGVTSFGKACGFSQPGVYVKVSKFIDWIIETLQQYGEQVTVDMFEPLVCANRNFKFRETNFGTEFTRSEKSIAQLLWSKQPSPDRCAGALIEPDAVVTLAQCILFNGMSPTHVKLFDSETIAIEKIVVHPNYTEKGNQLQNNIAILKLKTFSTFLPHCIAYNFIPNESYEYELEVPVLIPFLDNKGIIHDSSYSLSAWQSKNDTWNKSSLSSSLGQTNEHFFFGNHELLVPGSCYLALGGPIYSYSRSENAINGINFQARDCGFGELAMGIRLAYHKQWMESVFLPSESKHDVSSITEVLSYVDSDLEQGNRCRYDHKTEGRCVPVGNCTTATDVAKIQQKVIFCKITSVICCPNVLLKRQSTEIEREFNECESRYTHFRKERQARIESDRSLHYSHTAIIVRVQYDQIYFECLGYIISSRGVVTAASCLGMQPFDFQVYLEGKWWTDNTYNDELARIEKVTIHPMYNEVTKENDIAVLKLMKPIQSTVHLFPVCLWQHKTHVPVKQLILNDDSGVFEDIHPLYKRDCEKRLHRSMSLPGIGCMNPAYQQCSVSSYVGIQFEYVFRDCLKINQNTLGKSDTFRCYKAGNPIVWRRWDETNQTGLTEYLVGIYSHGDCHADISLRVVHHVAFYVEWFTKVLQ